MDPDPSLLDLGLNSKSGRGSWKAYLKGLKYSFHFEEIFSEEITVGFSWSLTVFHRGLSRKVVRFDKKNSV